MISSYFLSTILTAVHRTRLFYTHPNSSFEKGSCEKNHVHIRQIIPKGSEIRITQSQVYMSI